MADINILAPFILSFEGGFSNHPADKGGPTNKGVTIATWRQVGYDKDGDGDIDVDDIRMLTEEDVVERVMRPHYWNRWKGDQIRCQSIANLVVDWVWASGKYGITRVQKLLCVKQDGIVGPETLRALNSSDERELFARIMDERIAYIDNLCRKNASQKVFRKGWLRRLSCIGYGCLVYNGETAPRYH